MRHLEKDTVLNKINLKVENTKETPREILERHNPSMGNFPISGGWGYTQEDCVIINKNDPSVNQSMPFLGLEYEYLFVEKRIYEELIIFREPGQKFNGIKWEMLEQKLIFKDDRKFDHLHFLNSFVSWTDKQSITSSRKMGFSKCVHEPHHQSGSNPRKPR